MATKHDKGFCNLCGIEHFFTDLQHTETYALNKTFTDWLYLCQNCYNVLLKQNKLFFEKPKELINWNCFKINPLKKIKLNSKRGFTSKILLEIIKQNIYLNIEDAISKLAEFKEKNNDRNIVYSGINNLINLLWENGFIAKGRMKRNVFIKISPNYNDNPNFILENTRKKTRKKIKNKKTKYSQQLSFFNMGKYQLKRIYNFKKVIKEKIIFIPFQLSLFD